MYKSKYCNSSKLLLLIGKLLYSNKCKQLPFVYFHIFYAWENIPSGWKGGMILKETLWHSTTFFERIWKFIEVVSAFDLVMTITGIYLKGKKPYSDNYIPKDVH